MDRAIVKAKPMLNPYKSLKRKVKLLA